jgi:integrase
MSKPNVRFRLVKFRFETDAGGTVDRYMITDNQMPLDEPNQWIEAKSMRKASTGKEYAGKLVVYLNYLDRIGLEYSNANNRHVRGFLNHLLYGSSEDLKLRSPEAALSYSTLSKYIIVVTEFYKWLDQVRDTNMTFYERKNNIRARKSFLYGQIYTYDYQYIIDACLPRLKGRREYLKWYDDDTKDRICSGFLTLRDKAVFRLTLEGFRIDEVLSMTLDSYNAEERLIQPTRSKGKAEARVGHNPLRTVSLPHDTCELINRYIETERTVAENESGIISQYLFINLNKGRFQGQPLLYSNYRKSLLRCAQRSGLDTSGIRTHNGRSTKAMEFLEHQALHPEDGITDVIIAETFGWSSLDSIKHYRDHNNQIIAKAVSDKLHTKRGDVND